MNTPVAGNQQPKTATPAPALSHRPVLVWDIPTRLFHWLLVLMIVVSYATAEGRGVWFTVHKYTGYGALVLVLFRLGWGFVGGRHARFADFIRPFRAVRAHLLSVLALRPTSTVGHNPTGGWMMVALILFVFVQVATGLFAFSRRGAGPFAEQIPQSVARSIGGIHEALFNVLMVLIVVHIAGVIAESLLGKENLIRAMITGRKMLAADEADRESTSGAGGNAGPLGLALVLAALALGAVAALVNR